MQFSPSFIDIHKQLAPTLPIQYFAAAVSPQAIGLSSAADFYAPVRFSVQASGKPNDPTGIIRLDVAVKKNADWLRDMKAQLVETLSIRPPKAPLAKGESIDLRTVTGMPLERVPLDHLHNVGKLHIYQNEERVSVAALPPVPPEYRVTKTADLKQWAAGLADTLPQVVAAALKGKNIYEVEEALRSVGGAVVTAIQDHLSAGKQNFAEFVRLHQANSAKCAEPDACKSLLKKVSKQILTYIRTFINASQEDVTRHIAAEQAQKAIENAKRAGGAEDERLMGPVLVASPGPRGPGMRPNLYASLVEDAIKVPTLQMSLVSAIYNFDSVAASSAGGARSNNVISVARPIAKRVAASHHPWYAHIHHTLLPLRGTYPSDYLTRHTRKDMSARAPFMGDVQKTYDAYHRFAGVHTAPPPLKIKGGVALPLEGAMQRTPFVGDVQKTYEAYHRFAGLHAAPPPLKIKGGVPLPLEGAMEQIECHNSGSSSKSKKKGRSRHRRGDSSLSSSSSSGGEDIRAELWGGGASGMPRLIPIGSSAASGGGGAGAMPKLIPIGSSAASGGGGAGAMPALIPIGSSAPFGGGGAGAMPKLIPIGSSAASGGGGAGAMPKLIPIGSSAPFGGGGAGAMPKLIPIGSANATRPFVGELIPISDDIEAGVPVDEFPHLPSVEDIFK